jgi:hypothetical protein
MRTVFAALLVIGLFAAACGGDDDDGGNGGNGDVANIEDAETCEQVVDVAIAEVQNLLNAVSDMSMADLSGGETPEEIDQFQTEFDEIGAKSDEIGCTDEEIQPMFSERLDELTAEGPVAEMLLEELKNQDFGE